MSRIYNITKATARILFVAVNNLYCIPTYLVWVLLLQPIHVFMPALYWTIEGTLFRWMLASVAYWMWSADYKVAEMGADISECLQQESLITVNHQSTGDVPTLMYLLHARPGTADRVCWIMDYLFKYTNFGFVSQFHGDFFIQQGKDTRHLQGDKLKKHLEEVYQPAGRQWLILFPEGGFLYKRRETSQQKRKKYRLPVLQHVTLPRVGALQATLEVMGTDGHISNGKQNGPGGERRKLKWLVDITVGYPKGEPLDLLTITTGSRPPCQVVLYYKKYPITDLPIDQDALLKWMYDRAVEKEELLDTYYKTGAFQVPPDEIQKGPVCKEPKLILVNVPRVFLLHAFFMASTYLHYCMISGIVTSVLSMLW